MASGSMKDLHRAGEELRFVGHSTIKSDFRAEGSEPSILGDRNNFGKVNTIRPRKEGVTKVKLGSKKASEKKEDLHLAVEENNETLVLVLLRWFDVNAKDKDGKTALFIAAKKGQANMVSILLRRGAEVNTICNNGGTPLYGACKSGHEDVVRLLLEHKADVNMPNKYGRTPLHAAAQKQSISLITLLIDSGAHVNTPDNKGNTPLYKACQFGEKKTVQKLLELKADVNLKNHTGQTPFHIALQNKIYSILQLLVDSGAEINFANNNGETPLHRAVSRREKEELLVLLQLGANVDISNKKGETALDIAVKLQDTEMEAILENRMEKTTRDISFKKNHEDATGLLSQLKTQRGFEELDVPRNSANYAEIKSQINSLQELLSQETKYQQVILKNLLVTASRIICTIIGIRLEKLKKKDRKWQDLEELLDRGHTEMEVEDLEQKLKLLESDVIKARDVNTKFLPEMEQIMEDLQTCFAEVKRVTPRVENFKNAKEIDRLIKIINLELSKDISKYHRLGDTLKKKTSYINFQWEKFKKFEETLQDKINSVEKLQKELDFINIEVNPKDHGSLINDFEGQEKRTELFQTTLSELEKRLRQITGSLYKGSLSAHEEFEKLNSEIIILKSDILRCLGLLPIFKPRSGDNSKLIEFGQFQNRLNDITRDLAYEDDGIEKCEEKLKELKDDLLKSIIIPPVVIRAYPLITHSENNRGEDDDENKNAKSGNNDDENKNAKNENNDEENKNAKNENNDDENKNAKNENNDDENKNAKNGNNDDEIKNAKNGNNDDENKNAKNGNNDGENKNIKKDDQEGEGGSGVENATKGEDDEENKNTTREDKKHGKKREAQEEDEGEGPSMKRSKQEDESLNEELLMNTREGNGDQVKILIEKGANPNVMGENGMTPLMLAASNGFKTVVEELLRLRKEGKTNINKTDREGNTALHYSVLNNHRDIVLILLGNNACLNHENDDGKTPMDIAEQLEDQGIRKILSVHNQVPVLQHLIQNAGIINNFYQGTIANTLVNSENNNFGKGSGPQSFNPLS